MEIGAIIDKLARKENLTEEESKEVMSSIIRGEATSSQIGGYLVGLKVKGETTDEILGAVKALRSNMIPVNIEGEYLIDVCGTGGDGGKTFNISTATAIIAASAGIKISKHGNRAISSKCGSADVLRELNIPVDFDAEKGAEAIKRVGMAFLFAPNFHTAMKNVAKARGEIGTRTIFNLIGPLINPSNLKGQLMGIYDGRLLKTVGGVLKAQGLDRALVVHGEDGLDEITITTKTKVCEVGKFGMKEYTISPEQFGFKRRRLREISGGDAEKNGEIILKIIMGEKGPCRDVVVLNSAAALYVGNKVDSLIEGKVLAESLIDSGKVYDKYLELVSFN
ncbi:anthranilate phosphoribosyltransferase [Clostridium cavendishii DSM 21758]|uniref:Anthranilate phosphoribosyltransferase n=1 Tax=Clostridium cavendishii DSM 21758 TaxID=1121302 RepID=A0A1M6I5N6_9CLOT|nr:anthranilate phosphoribosyltransferase [Clostridium cavendishii]SHJ29772.1 anthranilate phosphoribosyltransferase [Clostridium cavendishii DSM 21758]